MSNNALIYMPSDPESLPINPIVGYVDYDTWFKEGNFDYAKHPPNLRDYLQFAFNALPLVMSHTLPEGTPFNMGDVDELYAYRDSKGRKAMPETLECGIQVAMAHHRRRKVYYNVKGSRQNRDRMINWLKYQGFNVNWQQNIKEWRKELVIDWSHLLLPTKVATDKLNERLLMDGIAGINVK